MARMLRTGAATEDLVAIFTEAAERSPALLARRRAAFGKTLGLLADNPGPTIPASARGGCRAIPTSGSFPANAG